MLSVQRNALLAGLFTLLLVAQVPAIEPPLDDRDATAQASIAAEAVTSPGAGGSSVVEGLVVPGRTKRLVYTCREGSIPTFSDRPCGGDARSRRLDLPMPVPVAAGGVPSTRPAAAPAATRPIAAPRPRGEAPLPADRCERLEEAVAAIDARMRQGYSAREAARLWERWRAAKAKLRDARC